MPFDQSEILNEITLQYLEEDENRPWILGFSGGKDSTMLLQMTWHAVQSIPPELRKRNIYVVCNNTLVENPKILTYVHEVLKLIQKAAFQQKLPITVHQTTPVLQDSFWVNLIGKGYPAPNNKFRWCTERLKIKPTTQFILDKIDTFGEVIILLGTRREESSNRAASMSKHAMIESRLSKHPLPNAYSFSPLENVITDEVWIYLLMVKSPWGADNRRLMTMYKNASGGDCPIVVDTDTPSCGNSRFGCWVCTVVDRDKSMEALIDNGEDWMEPLLEIRDYLNSTVDRRNPEYDPFEYRMNIRRTGQEGIGPYKPEIRQKILEKVLLAQKDIQDDQKDAYLISHQELVAIQVIWYRDNYFDLKVSDIYNRIFNREIDLDYLDENLVREKELLREACEKKPGDFELINDLLKLQHSRIILLKKRGLQKDLEQKLEQHIKKATA
jgi:DNA sulfur modification protein DndC